MNKRIRELAKQAGIDSESDTLCRYEGWSEPIERFAALVVADEREACAKLCEARETYSMPIPCPDGISGCLVAHYAPGSRLKDGVECAAAIRARGEK
jgi:hypothetical protein